MLDAVARCRPRSRSRASTGSPRGRARPGRPASPATGSQRCRPAETWSHGRTSSSVPVPVDVPVDGQPVAGHGVGPQVEVEVLGPLLERAAGRQTSSITAPIRRSPRLAMPSASVALGSCHRNGHAADTAGPRPSAGRPCGCSSSIVFCPNHWNGVWALGTKPPTDAVTVTPLVWRAPDRRRSCAGQRRRCPSVVLVGLGGQADQEVELDPPPALAEGRVDGAVEVLLADQLVDDLAHPPRPALGGEGQAGAPDLLDLGWRCRR